MGKNRFGNGGDEKTLRKRDRRIGPSNPEVVRLRTVGRKSGKPEPPGERRGTKRFVAGGSLPQDLSRKEIEQLVHELEVHQVELEMQNHELRQTQLDLEASRNKYSDLYDFSPVGYFTFDQYGVVLDANLTGAAQLGIERKSLINRPFHLHIPPESKTAFRAHMRAVLNKKSRQSCEIGIHQIVNKQPRLFFAQLDSIYIEEINGPGQCRTAITDVTDRRSAELSLRETNETLQALIHAAPLAIYAIDSDGRVKSWNRAAERVFGWRREEVIGYLLPTIPYEKTDEFAALRERVMRGETLVGFETVRQKKNGSRIHVNLSTALLYSADGSIRGIVGIAEEITERKRSEEAIQEMNKALKEKNRQVESASRARKKFFSYISHELKTPLNSIIGFTQLLRNGNYGTLSSPQSRALRLVYRNAGELLRLINNILDLAKIESGKMPTHLTGTDLPELVERVCLVFEPFIEEKALRLERTVGPNFPKDFLTDPNKMKSILGNLMSNAVKFTESGVIRVDLRFSEPDGGIQIVMSDTGRGIKQADIGKIFDEYEQTSTSGEDVEGYTKGSGLGLAIVKKMVESLNGTIDVKSEPGSGSTFTIEIPTLSTS